MGIKVIRVQETKGDIESKKIELIRLAYIGKMGIYLSFQYLATEQFLATVRFYHNSAIKELAFELDTVVSFKDIPSSYVVRLKDLDEGLETVLEFALNAVVKKVVLEYYPDEDEIEITIRLPLGKILGVTVPFDALSSFFDISLMKNIDKAIK